MGSKIIFVVKIDRANNAKSIGDNAKFVSVAEMSVNVLLLYFMVRGSRCWHGSIGGFIWVIRTVKVIGFCIGFQLLNDAVGVRKRFVKYRYN